MTPLEMLQRLQQASAMRKTGLLFREYEDSLEGAMRKQAGSQQQQAPPRPSIADVAERFRFFMEEVEAKQEGAPPPPSQTGNIYDGTPITVIED